MFDKDYYGILLVIPAEQFVVGWSLSCVGDCFSLRRWWLH